jgi:peptide deformylase
MILDIVTYPDPRLKHKSAPLLDQHLNPSTTFTSVHRQLFQDLIDTMYAKDGIGLAAIQIGFPLRVFVLDDNGPVLFVNPEIKNASADKEIGTEGCISFPGVAVKIERSTSIAVSAYNADGNSFTYERSGLHARVVQHEMDHLAGVTFFDKLPRLDRELAIKRYRRRLGK